MENCHVELLTTKLKACSLSWVSTEKTNKPHATQLCASDDNQQHFLLSLGISQIRFYSGKGRKEVQPCPRFSLLLSHPYPQTQPIAVKFPNLPPNKDQHMSVDRMHIDIQKQALDTAWILFLLSLKTDWIVLNEKNK